MPGRVLIVDDDAAMCDMAQTDLRLRGYAADTRTDASAALEAMAQGDFDVVLTDLRMPGMDGLELCRQIAARRPDVPVIVFTAFGSVDAAIAAIHAGAYDFVTKPVDMEVLALAFERALQHRLLQRRVHLLDEEVRESRRFGEIIGSSPAMERLYDQLHRLCGADVSVLITGESGTGKELVARALHRGGSRRAGPFVAVNCAALPATLLESELFGHRRGAFTDARADRDGLLVEADGGTLFLDEVGDLPVSLQPKLLRALAEGAVRPLGDSHERAFDTRILAATHCDLEAQVETGQFREDLYFRLNVVQLDLPPLRERGDDVLLLARHYLELFSTRHGKELTGLTAPVAERFLRYRWPGNVRELRNAIERAVVLARFDQLTIDDLPARIAPQGPVDVDEGELEALVSLAEVERRYIEHVMRQTGGSRTRAAEILGVDRKTLYRKLQRFDSTAEADPIGRAAAG